jgi:hypothetical protein
MSLLFYQRFDEITYLTTHFHGIKNVQTGSGSVIYLPPGSRSVLRIRGSGFVRNMKYLRIRKNGPSYTSSFNITSVSNDLRIPVHNHLNINRCIISVYIYILSFHNSIEIMFVPKKITQGWFQLFIMLSYFIVLFRIINVLVFRYYNDAQQKIVLLKIELYCTMFTQTALFLLIKKRLFRTSFGLKILFSLQIFYNRRRAKRSVSQEAGRRTELTEPGPTG